MSSKACKLLEALLSSPGRVLTKSELMRAAWGDTAVEESNLSVQIAALRKQLGPPLMVGLDHNDTTCRIPLRRTFSTRADRRDSETSSPPIEREHRPSIAVLPFANLGGDKEQEYLADGITEDIITALTRFRWFFCDRAQIQASHTKASHLMQSSCRRSLECDICWKEACANPASIPEFRPKLVDATSGNHIWAERYDLELTELFAIQDAIAERVAGAIEPELLRTEGAQAVGPTHRNMTAWIWSGVGHGTFIRSRVRTI